MPGQHTLADVSIHDKQEDAWLVVHGKVYDVTDFVDKHPGGERVLVEHAGTDATWAFDDIGHSRWARFLLKRYCIGELPGAEEGQGELPRAAAAAAAESAAADATAAEVAAAEAAKQNSCASSDAARNLLIVTIAVVAAGVLCKYWR